MAFVHFGIHSEFSIVDSIIRIKALVKAAAADNMPALALTDLSNIYGTVKFYEACLAEGIKPIIGSEIMLADADSRATLIALSNSGYTRLTEVISLGYTQSKLIEQNLGEPIIATEWVRQNSDGIALLLGQHSDVGKALLSSHPERAIDLMQDWLDAFNDRVYLQILRTSRTGEDAFIAQCVWLLGEFAKQGIQIPVIAHNDVRFLSQDDYEAHEVRVCIASKNVLADQNRERTYSAEQYFKSQSQMRKLFADIPAVCDNTVELAKRANVTLEIGKNYLPDYPIPAGDTIETFFTRISYDGLDARLAKLYPESERTSYPTPWADTLKTYQDRLQYEIDIIANMGFIGYFLIVMDFIRWAKENGVPVGPGRGSGAGSLVAYSLNITDLDPLAYDLLFERFLNPERVSMPDFDIDFCVAGRDRVIDYVARQYGRDAVSQIITFGTMAAKAVVRDVARVQGKSFGLADKISKLIPSTPGISLAEAAEQEQQLKDLLNNPNNLDYDDATEIWEMALKLEGLARNVGKHAGGVLIAPGKITDFTAIYTDEEGHRTSQFDKDDVEKVGLVKFDFLGLKNLTVIDAAVRSINARKASIGEPPLDISALPLDDKPTYQLLKDAKSTAVFQLESAGMKKYLKKLEPSDINDVIAMCALYRPGPLDAGMVEMYIERKHGREKVIYDHPDLVDILKPTYGVIVYQEQVMQISQVMAGYTLGGADMLRRAMGKKKPEEMAKQRVIFVEGARGKGIEEEVSGGVFDLMEKFAGYGFNKSHSAAYGIIAYQTAYLKTHYTAEFMAEVLTFDAQNTDNVVFFIDDCRKFGIAVTPPSVNDSFHNFVVRDAHTIIYGLGAIKGVGESAVESIVEARKKGGKFTDLFDFCARVDLKKVAKRCLEALIKAGAFDCFASDFGKPKNSAHHARGTLWEQLPEAVQAAEQARKNAEVGMVDLFGEVVEAQRPTDVRQVLWSDEERLKGEKSTLGLYLTGHPIDTYRDEIQAYFGQTIAELGATKKHQTTTFAGLVVDVANFGNRILVVLDDGTSRIDISCFSDRFARFKDIIKLDTVLVVEAQISEREGYDKPMARLEKAKTLFDERIQNISSISIIDLQAHDADAIPLIRDTFKELAALQEQAKNKHAVSQMHLPPEQKTPLRVKPVHFTLKTNYATAEFILGSESNITPTNDVLTLLKTRFGTEAVRLNFLKTKQRAEFK